MRELHNTADAVRWFSDTSAPVRHAMVRTISANQDQPPAVQVFAVACALVALCDALSIDPHEMVTRIRVMEKALTGPYGHQFEAMKDYARGELQ